jgi:hypothetical protein
VKLASRLAKIELRFEGDLAARLIRRREEENSLADPVWQAVVSDARGGEALGVVAGLSIYESGGKSRIPDEHDIEQALVCLGELFQVHAERLGYTVAPRGERDRDSRIAMLTVEDTDFNRALHRFAGVGVANLALVQRYMNACRSRANGKDRETEYGAAVAALDARLKPFLAAEGEASPDGLPEDDEAPVEAQSEPAPAEGGT